MANDSRHLKRVDVDSGYQTRNALCSPILGEGGEATGVVQALNKMNGPRFTKDDEKYIRKLGKQMGLLVRGASNQLTFSNVIRPRALRTSFDSDGSPARHGDGMGIGDPDEGGGHQIVRGFLRFLVVDDMSVDRKMLRYSLEHRLGHDVEEAKSGLEALAKVQKSMVDLTPFDAVFLDHVMPVMDGPAACRAILEAGFEGMIFGVTAFTNASASLFTAAGVDEIFEKPMSFQLLLKVVSGE